MVIAQLKKEEAFVSVLEKQALSQVNPGLVKMRPQLPQPDSGMDVRISEGLLDVGNRVPNDAPIFPAQSPDFGSEVIVQLDLFQSKKLGLKRPLTRVTLPSSLRFA